MPNNEVGTGRRMRSPEPGVSITPPFGQLDERLPLRGRQKLLTELDSAGSGGGVGANGGAWAWDTTASARVRVVWGLGGSGKTRLALEAASRAQQRGAEVWWVSAAQPQSLAAGMRALGQRLGLSESELQRGDAADIIWQRLRRWQAPWMLVIDSADDPQLLAGPRTSVADGRGWLRPLGGTAGTVLVTSRDGSPITWGSWCQRHQLDRLAVDAAAAVLADRVGRNPGAGSEEDARLLVARLGGLPLALKIAGCYLAEAASIPAAFAGPDAIRSYRAYLAALEDGDRDRLFPLPDGPLNARQALALIGQTRELTLRLLEARRMPEARQVLRLLATFAEAPVPYQLLLDPALLAAFAPLQDISGYRLWQVLRTLDEFGLIDLDAGQKPGPVPLARVHPLIRNTCRPADGPERLAFLGLAARLLERAAQAEEMGAPEDPSTQPAWRALVPHTSAVLSSVAAEPDCPEEVSAAAATAAYLTALFQAQQGFHAAAEAELRDVRAVQLRVLGADHPDTLDTRYEIAVEMAVRGDHAAAEAELREILTAELAAYGAEHPETLTTRHEIAWEMAKRGDQAAADAELQDILSTRLRVLGPDHPDTKKTAESLDDLARRRNGLPATSPRGTDWA